jgi:hypothetical protein
MDAAERNRLIAATRGYGSLRGLIYAPAGLLNAATPLLDAAWPRGGAAKEWVILTMFVSVIVAFFAALSFYRRRFGVVRHNVTTAQIIGGIAFFAAMFALRGPQAASLHCVWWAAFYLACYLSPFGLRTYSLWFAALFLGLGGLAQAGVLPNQQFLPGGGQAFISLALSIHGLLDHLLLLLLLPRATPATVPNA